MAKFSSRHLVMLRKKLKLTEKIFIFVSLYFAALQCTGHQPISVADLCRSVHHLKPLIQVRLKISVFFNFAWEGWGDCSPAIYPPPRMPKWLQDIVADPSLIQTESFLNLRSYRDSISVKFSLLCTLESGLRSHGFLSLAADKIVS
jgi:hypothetical protein